MVSVLDSGAEGRGFKSVATLSGNRLRPRQTVRTHRASVYQAAKLVAALLRVARVTAGLAESNGSRCEFSPSTRNQSENRRIWSYSPDGASCSTQTYTVSALQRVPKNVQLF